MLFIDKYIEEHSLIIHEIIKERKIIYLDLKYWILLRDKGANSNSLEANIVDKVNELHEAKKCIFPVSEIVFWEIMKQGDEKTRSATITLVEKLSCGYAIIGEHQRVKVEFSNWIRVGQKTAHLKDRQKFVWSKLHLVVGYFFYSKKAEELPSALRTSFLDFVSNIPLSEIPSDPRLAFTPFRGKDDVDALNESKEKYKHENKSFKAMFLSELWGCLDCFNDDLNAVMHESFFRTAGRELTDEEISKEDKTAWSKLIYQGFKSDKLSDQLPMFKIFPSLFASMRWNKDRKYQDGNDTLDVMHATNALPYCDYFFTERELHTMITQSKLDSTFNCIVESKPDRVLEILNSF